MSRHEPFGQRPGEGRETLLPQQTNRSHGRNASPRTGVVFGKVDLPGHAFGYVPSVVGPRAVGIEAVARGVLGRAPTRGSAEH